ncbi:hypothetical protein FPV67DRAFT_1412971 [Lyophyllum atratum]|nr:hypothetical protein FPV67DRAFT_1412971 [Lyophyllum atratum]
MAAPPASAARRFKQQVYVDVPLSPYLIHRQSSNKSAPIHALASDVKENTPLRPSNGRSMSNALKRKISEHDLSVAKPNPTKRKLTDAPALPQQSNVASNACPEFPNGFAYCHQCSKKRDALLCMQCTSVTYPKGVEKRCSAKYCESCLKNRYGEDASEIKSRGAKRSEKGHVENTNFTFKCPRCRDICNCWKCRKAKGLPATGMEVFISTTPSQSFATKGSVETASKASVRKKAKQQAQALPVLKWTAVPTDLDLSDAEARFQIREFILRFASVMEPKIPKTLLAELEDVGCDRGGSDDTEMAPWVSEGCVRSMILGLLGMLADKDGGSIEKVVESAIRDIRATGNNLSKVWPILARMRDAIESDVASTSQDDSPSEVDTILSFPDPLPPPASATIYNTRTTRSARESNGTRSVIIIAHPAQMIPVVEALIEAAFETGAVREEIDSGVQDAKEKTREVKDCIKAENERWDAERKELESKMKGKETEKKGEKRRVLNLENALKLVLPGFAPRFAPLGTDSGGRVFWALSPGVKERNTALEFIASVMSGTKEIRKSRQGGRAMAEDEDRSATSEWSWFVVVYGRKFPASLKPTEKKGDEMAVDDDSDDDDEDLEQWWGFYEPSEIRNVANWIRIDAGIDLDGDAEDNMPLASLVKGLNDYAALLEWRLEEDRYQSQDIRGGADKRA